MQGSTESTGRMITSRQGQRAKRDQKQLEAGEENLNKLKKDSEGPRSVTLRSRSSTARASGRCS